MGMHITKTVVSLGIVVWQKILETFRGGFSLSLSNLTAGMIVPAGTLVSIDEKTRIATVIKTAVLHTVATATDTDYKVLKGHILKVGDNIAYAIGGKAYAITAINTSDFEYDTVTVGTTLAGTPAAGTVLFTSTATGASAAAASPSGATSEEVVASSHADVGVVARGTVYANRIPAVPSALRDKLPLIIFSESH